MSIKTIGIILAAQLCLTGCTFHKEAKQDSLNNTQPLDAIVNDDDESVNQSTKSDQEIDAGVYKASNIDLSKYNYAIIDNESANKDLWMPTEGEIQQIYLYDNNMFEITLKYPGYKDLMYNESFIDDCNKYGLDYDIEGCTKTYLVSADKLILIDKHDEDRYVDERSQLEDKYYEMKDTERQNQSNQTEQNSYSYSDDLTSNDLTDQNESAAQNVLDCIKSSNNIG